MSPIAACALFGFVMIMPLVFFRVLATENDKDIELLKQDIIEKSSKKKSLFSRLDTSVVSAILVVGAYIIPAIILMVITLVSVYSSESSFPPLLFVFLSDIITAIFSVAIYNALDQTITDYRQYADAVEHCINGESTDKDTLNSETAKDATEPFHKWLGDIAK